MSEEGRNFNLGDVLEPSNQKMLPLDCLGIPYIGLDNIEAQTTRLLGVKDSSEMKSSAKCFKKGDVLYSRLRPYLNKVWLADRDGLCSAEFIVLPQNDFVDGGFLKYRLSARDFVSFANSLNAGDRPRVDFEGISSFLLPPFSLSYQRSVVARIEELFSEIDAGVESFKQARKQLGLYRQSLLQQAFCGKLTEAWRAANPDKLEDPEELLERIRQEREARYQQQVTDWETAVEKWEVKGKGGKKPGRPKKPKDIEMPSKEEYEKLSELPSKWSWCFMANLGELGRGKSKHRPRNAAELFGGQYPFVQTGEVKAANKVIRSYTQTYSEKGLAQSKIWPQGTLCITIAANIAETAFLGFDGCFPDSVVGFVSIREIVRDEYVELFIRSARSRIENFAPATAQKNINLTTLENLMIPLCSLPEQNEIVHLLESQFTAIEQNEREIDAALKRADALRQSILKKAFSGQLVPQDPNDEPASELLARIREERAVTQTKTKAKRKSPTKKAASVGARR